MTHLRAPIAAAALLAAVPALPAAGVQFTPDYAGALKAAKAGDLPVMVEFTMGAGCRYCVELETKVLTDTKVVRTAKRFVNVQVKSSSPLARQYQISGFPTIVFLNAKGEEVDRIRGLPSADMLLDKAQAVAGKAEEAAFAALESAAADGKADAWAKALRRLAVVPTDKAREKVVEALKREDAPEAVRKAALESVVKQEGGPDEAVPFLAHKTLRPTAEKALRGLPAAEAVPALFNGLERDEPAVRAASYALAQSLTKYNRGVDMQFWQTGDAAARQRTLAAWREWWDKKTTGGKPSVGGT